VGLFQAELEASTTLSFRDIPRGAAKLAVEGAAWYEKKVEGLPAPSGDDVYTLFGKKSRAPTQMSIPNTVGRRAPSR
jgi:hypothetical protein